MSELTDSQLNKLANLEHLRSGTKKQIKAEFKKNREGFHDMNLGTKTFVDKKHKAEKHKHNYMNYQE